MRFVRDRLAAPLREQHEDRAVPRHPLLRDHSDRNNCDCDHDPRFFTTRDRIPIDEHGTLRALRRMVSERLLAVLGVGRPERYGWQVGHVRLTDGWLAYLLYNEWPDQRLSVYGFALTPRTLPYAPPLRRDPLFTEIAETLRHEPDPLAPCLTCGELAEQCPERDNQVRTLVHLPPHLFPNHHTSFEFTFHYSATHPFGHACPAPAERPHRLELANEQRRMVEAVKAMNLPVEEKERALAEIKQCFIAARLTLLERERGRE